MVKKHYYDPLNREEWLRLRQEISGIGIEGVCRVGASDVYAVIGKSPYKSPIRCFYVALGRTKGEFNTEKMANGLLIEQHIKNRYQYYSPDEEQHIKNMMTQTKVNKVRNVNAIVVSSEFDYIAASLDIERCKGEANFFTGEVMDFSYPIDLKNISFMSNRSKNDEMGEGYETQLIAQMIATETTYSELCVQSDGWKLKIHPCFYNEEKANRIKQAVKEFCEAVIQAKPLEVLYQSDIADEPEWTRADCLNFIKRNIID